jgi:hypothetical protein
MKRTLPYPLLRLFRIPHIRTSLTWMTLLAFMHLTFSCNYYRLRQEEELTAQKLAGIPNYKRFIVHHGSDAWELKEVKVLQDQLEGSLQPVPNDLLRFLNAAPGNPVRYKKQESLAALNVVHLHIFEYSKREGSQVSIPFSSLKRIDIADHDSGTTVASHVLSTIGILTATFALLVVIVLLTKSSCPYVYAHNGESYSFVGEAYGGAIFSPLERDDYMPLPRLLADQQTYRVKIANELRERQYTNLAQLLTVQHQEDVKVLLDDRGRPHTLQDLQAPLSAPASDGLDYASQLSARDSSSYLFNHSDTALNRLTLQFRKPKEARQSKLVLHARNSLWLDYIFGEFTKQFGSVYNSWAGKQKDVPAQEHHQWQQEQGIPLLVEIRTSQGWKKAAELPPVGPLASRDLVVPLDLSETGNNTLLEVRLSSGFLFWEIDQAGMDFSQNLPVGVELVKPSTAFDRQGIDNRSLLSEADKDYLQQFNVGDQVELSFRLPETQPGQVRSSFLHTRGYYEHIREYKGLPDLLELKRFKEPGHFTRFSRDRYIQLLSEHHLKHLSSAHAPLN